MPAGGRCSSHGRADVRAGHRPGTARRAPPTGRARAARPPPVRAAVEEGVGAVPAGGAAVGAQVHRLRAHPARPAPGWRRAGREDPHGRRAVDRGSARPDDRGTGEGGLTGSLRKTSHRWRYPPPRSTRSHTTTTTTPTSQYTTVA